MLELTPGSLPGGASGECGGIVSLSALPRLRDSSYPELVATVETPRSKRRDEGAAPVTPAPPPRRWSGGCAAHEPALPRWNLAIR